MKFFYNVVLVALTIYVVSASSKSRDVHQAISPRNGELLLSSTIKDDATMYFKGPFIDNVKETSFSDLLAHLLGVQPVNEYVSREHFPETNPFLLPRLNLLVNLPGIGKNVLTSNAISFESLAEVQLVPELYPRNSFSTLATIATGAVPAVHGIPGQAWIDESGDIVKAYSSNGVAFVTNLADSVAHSSNGRAMTLSASFSAQHASVFAVQDLTFSTRGRWKNYMAYCDVEEQTLVQQAGLNAPFFPGVSLNQLVEQLKANDVSIIKSEDSVVIEFGSEKTSFSLQSKEDIEFLIEFALFQQLAARIDTSSNGFSFITFTFSTLEPLLQRYGSESAELRAALIMVQSILSAVQKELSASFGDRFLMEVVFPGTANPLPQPEVFNGIHSALYASVQTKKQFETLLPNVYLQSPNSCGKVQSLLSTLGVESYCVSAYAPQLVQPRVFFPSAFLSDSGNSTGNSTVTGDQLATFHMLLWAGIIILVVVVIAAYSIFSMEYNTDSFLLTTPDSSKHLHTN